MPNAGQDILAADFDEMESDVDNTSINAFTDTTFVPGTPVVGTTFVAPTSGNVLVLMYGRLESNTAAVRAIMSFAVREGGVIGSGTTVTAASAARSITTPTDATGGGNQRATGTVAYPLTGLTPGDIYNAQVEYELDAAGNGDIFSRTIIVIPMA